MSLCRIFRPDDEPFRFLASRGLRPDAQVVEVVAGIIESVRLRGDEALLESARRFDSPRVESILVSDQELESASIAQEYVEAIRTSVSRVREFHEAQMAALTAGWQQAVDGYRWTKQEQGGGYTGQRLGPVSTAGIYVPGGKANYPSSVVMNCVPALSAGVKNLAVCSPAGEHGGLSPAVLVAAREVGIRTIAKVGGAAAIAAFAFGTESVPRADVVAGPGNRYVNEAKRQLWGQVGLDLYAGPSEVCVLVDETSNPEFAAADWLTQVEHAQDNAGFIVSTSKDKVFEIFAAAERQLEDAPRASVIRAALTNYGAAMIARDLEEAIDLVDAIAPEHLTISTANPEEVAVRIENAGCILLGEYTPESAGDYAIGPSHTLPTATAARFASPLNVLTFLKIQSVTNLSREALEQLNSAIRALGEMEGLPTHGNGSAVRFLRSERRS